MYCGPTSLSRDNRPTLQVYHWMLFGVLFIAAFSPVLSTWLQDLWQDSNYSHGLLIPFVSGYFIYKRFDEIKKIPLHPTFSAFVILIPALLIFMAGHIGSEFFSQRISLLLILYGALYFLGGKQFIKPLRFPLFILFFAVPLPYILYNSVAFPLKLVATKLAVFLIDLTGLPVYADGNIIYLTHATLEVVDACSGIRSLMTLVTLAFFLAYVLVDGLWKRTLILILALPITIVANSLRVASTAILTKFDPAWGHGFVHEFTGWLIFIFSFWALACIAILLKKKTQ